MKQKKVRLLALTLAVAGCISTGMVSAYFTDGDSAVNTFTNGKISIDLQEPHWNPDAAKNMTPKQEVAKDPKVLNDGINDAYVFMRVTVPYANVTVAEDNGTKAAAKSDKELYKYDIDDLNWTEIGTPQKDTRTRTVTHVYAFAKNNTMTALAANASTSALFEYIQLINVVEDEGLEETVQNVKVEALAIQTRNINDEKTSLDGDNSDGKTTPAEVWSVLSVQNPATADKN